MKKPWQKMTEGEQTLEIERATDRAEQLLEDVVDLVSAGDFPVVHAIIDNYQSKNGEVKIVAKGVAEDDVILNLHHAGKKPVKIVIADRQQFDQGRDRIAAEPDQPDLLSANEVNGSFDDSNDPPSGDNSDFDDAAEQAAGANVLDLPLAPEDPPAHGPITDMRGYPEGPMEAMRDGKRWWSDDGIEWREATDEDVLPTDKDDVPVQPLDFDPNESLPGVDPVDDEEHPLEREVSEGTGTAGDDAGFDDSQDPAPVAGGAPSEEWPDDAQIAKQKEDAAAAGADPETGEVTLSEAELEETRAEGVKARKDGHAPKANPYPKMSARFAAFAEGYNAEKKAEKNAKPKPDDADFDN
jgi:hypothetical protein